MLFTLSLPIAIFRVDWNGTSGFISCYYPGSNTSRVIAMSIRFEETDEKLIIRFVIPVVTQSASEQVGVGFHEIAQRAAATKKGGVIDFRGVQFMTSAIIGDLVLLNRYMKTERIPVRLWNVSPNVLEVFKITRLDKVFAIVDEDDDSGPGPADVPARKPDPPDSGTARAAEWQE